MEPLPTEPRQMQRPRRTIWLTAGLGVIAFLPFALVFMQSAGRERGALVLTEGDSNALADGLRMLSPSYSGHTPNGEPFIVTADWALPDSPDPSRVDLRGIEATVTLKDGRIATMSSSEGAFFPRVHRLRLENGVAATTSDGYRIDTKTAIIDSDTRMLRTEGPIRASGPSGSIRANMLEALDAEDRIVKFTGDVRVVFEPDTAAKSE